MLISVEGLDGASKGTSIATLCGVLERSRIEHVVFREPGGTPLAESIRLIHKSIVEEYVSPKTETLLLFAARTQSYANLVLPALEQGKVVILDRCWWSTYAYQIFQNLDESLFWFLQNEIELLAPVEQVLLLDVPPSVGLVRAGKRGELDRIELKELSFFERARQGYQTLATQYSNITHTINSDRHIETVQSDVTVWAKNLVEIIQARQSTVSTNQKSQTS